MQSGGIECIHVRSYNVSRELSDFDCEDNIIGPLWGIEFLDLVKGLGFFYCSLNRDLKNLVLQVALVGSTEVGKVDVWLLIAILGGIVGYIAKIYFG